jgi:hypothetical protein
VAGSVARGRGLSSDEHSLTSPPRAPDQPLDLTHGVPLGLQGVLHLTEAVELLPRSCH